MMLSETEFYILLIEIVLLWIFSMFLSLILYNVLVLNGFPQVLSMLLSIFILGISPFVVLHIESKYNN
jgi:hypothetical protein